MSEKVQFDQKKRLNQLRVRASIGLASLALLAGAGSKPVRAEEPPTIEALPEFIMGAQEDSVLSQDVETSQDTAAQIREAHFNTLKITMPWTYPRQCAEIDNDLLRFQNAVSAARENDLTLMLNLIPGGGSGLGKAPITPSQQRCFIDTNISYLHAYAERWPAGHLVLEWPNEPNSSQFWRQQRNRKGEWVAPRAVTRMLNSGYEQLKTEAEELGIGLTIIGGALASKNRAIDFINEMGKSKNPASMDAFSLHPYGAVNNEAPAVEHPGLTTVGFADFRHLASAVNKNVGRLPIIYSEYGVKTDIPDDKEALYTRAPQSAKTLVDEKVQADFYKTGIEMAYCQRRIGGLILFNFIDDSDGFWTSGLKYPDGTPKSSYDQVAQTVSQASSGQLDCGQ